MQARIGVVKSALRLGEFIDAQSEANTLKQQAPRSADVLAVHADACGRRPLRRGHQEFRMRWRWCPTSRGHHGMARALASQNKLDEALNEAQAALKLSPRDEEIHHTVGAIYERMRRYEEAAAAYSNYVNLLPNKDRSDKAAWSRSQIRFLRSFGEREPIAIDEAAGDDGCTPSISASSTTRSSSRPRSTAAGRRTSCSTPAPSSRRSRARRRRARWCARSPTRSAPASAKSACAACSSGADRFAGDRHAEAEQRAVR